MSPCIFKIFEVVVDDEVADVSLEVLAFSGVSPVVATGDFVTSSVVVIELVVV